MAALQKTYFLTVPLKNREMSPVFVVVESDINGNKLIITLTHDGLPFNLTGASNITFTCLKADGNAVVDTATILDAETGKIEYVLHQQCLTCPGIVQATIEVYSDEGTTRITSTQFTFEVRGQLNDGSAIPSQEEYPVLLQLIADCEEIKTAEEARVLAESLRVEAENNREISESDRESAEAERASAESLRAIAENARQNNEVERVSAESARAAAEALRVSAENARESAESTRVSNENIRIGNESSRVNAENLRVIAENARANAETARVTAENARQTAIGNFVHRGEYSADVTYQQKNIVSFQGGSYMAKVETTGHPPTDTNYWSLLASKGEKGAKLSYKGSYSAEATYTVGDLVAYGGNLYSCILDSTGNLPTNPTYWSLFLEGGVSTHNDLSGLNEGNYLHLTANEKANMETKDGAQAKANAAQAAAEEYADVAVEALAGEGNTKTVKQVADEVAAHLNDYVKQMAFAVASGTNTYTVTIDGITELVEGLSVKVKFTNANTGASTLNINSLGAKAIKKGNGNDLAAGNVKAGQICHLVYTGVNFQLLGEGGEYGTAQAQHVLAPYTIGTEEGIVEGTMPDNGAVVITPGTTNKAIAEGYHNGNGYVSGVSIQHNINKKYLDTDARSSVTTNVTTYGYGYIWGGLVGSGTYIDMTGKIGGVVVFSGRYFKTEEGVFYHGLRSGVVGTVAFSIVNDTDFRKEMVVGGIGFGI